MGDAADLAPLYESLAAELSRQTLIAWGRTAPNPAVAAAILLPDPNPAVGLRVVCAATEPAGLRHAEIAALDRLEQLIKRGEIDSEQLRRATLYVTLEPCNHYGRTPPCSERIVSTGWIEKVHIGVADPDIGKGGAERLQSAGVKVAPFAPELLRIFSPRLFLGGFLGRIKAQKPRLHLKLAVSPMHSEQRLLFGSPSTQLRISGHDAAIMTHLLRARLDAVVVGPGTISCDAPALTLRLPRADDYMALNSLSALSELACNISDPLLAALLRSASQLYESLSCLGESGDGMGEIVVRADRPDSCYQPQRIFLLGDYGDYAATLLARQRELSDAGYPSARYLAVGKRASRFWAGVVELEETLPELNDNHFSSALRQFLARSGLSEILVEGGGKLIERLSADAVEHDRLYLYRSRLDPARFDGLVEVRTLAGLPGVWHLRDSVDFASGEDRLELYTPGEM